MMSICVAAPLVHMCGGYCGTFTEICIKFATVAGDIRYPALCICRSVTIGVSYSGASKVMWVLMP